ncbi:hypothetical protein HFE03_07445 [Paenibacillus sp. EKM102P]|uniref:hypothetical protein n=1 Tax=unclassified Paenibacillus TaxID=185978 RepID=UPI00142DCD0F|nr:MULTISPECIES: hypothetical protein [unclassified Paenibacillus]KAF6620480.1 hypothetical protein HFE00_05350 [Paenibacillus sp. EKM101P]KAF6623472.1 hypothetical protein HFE03_07445 [Paenibacillus sp. EKM102P]KAF6633965.1 hypothetical protein HFE01_07060 [Paenibacillus sp. EKM10P]KAF6649492.1 hypothetical protein HFE02_02025 [Paenibacillus sp. EKM11P]
MELIFREKVMIYNLLSERYHELKNKPESRDENTFQELEDMYIKFGAHLEKEYGKDWWK